MKTHAVIAQEIFEHLTEMSTFSPPSFEADLLDSGTLDSMGVVELLFHVEQTYEVELPMHEIDLEDLRTVGNIAGLIVARCAPGAASQQAALQARTA